MRVLEGLDGFLLNGLIGSHLERIRQKRHPDIESEE